MLRHGPINRRLPRLSLIIHGGKDAKLLALLPMPWVPCFRGQPESKYACSARVGC
jgi:hypothetical protein